MVQICHADSKNEKQWCQNGAKNGKIVNSFQTDFKIPKPPENTKNGPKIDEKINKC